MAQYNDAAREACFLFAIIALYRVLQKKLYVKMLACTVCQLYVFSFRFWFHRARTSLPRIQEGALPGHQAVCESEQLKRDSETVVTRTVFVDLLRVR